MSSCPPPLHQDGTDDGGKKEFCLGRVRSGMPVQHLTGDVNLGDSRERVVSEARVTHHKSEKRATPLESIDRVKGGGVCGDEKPHGTQ